MSAESLLCKAAGELILARRERPDEARPCWYLFEVWSQLAQRQPAARWLRAAEDAAPFSYLTPAERARPGDSPPTRPRRGDASEIAPTAGRSSGVVPWDADPFAPDLLTAPAPDC